jgi:glycosyltransferase involved in cell wall biosynthesis
MDAKGSFNWRFLSRLVQLIRRERIDLVQSHLLGSNVYCSLAGLITHTPVVATFHGVVDIGDRDRLKGIKYAAINAGARCIVAVSDSLRNEIRDRTSLKVEKIKLIYNGINTEDFINPHSRDLRQIFGWTGDEVIIGSLGNIRPAKGYDILLRAAELVAQRSHRFRFVIAGQCNTSLYNELLLLRQELDLEHTVQFLGYIDDAADFLSNIDIFLSSSISEGLPLSAIQAMVAELPIVATRCGGYEELVTDRENGWLVEIGKPQAIADALECLAADSEVMTGLAEKARKHAIDTFDLEVMLNAYEKLYDELTAE